MPAKPEAFSRVLIDQALKESGWDLLDDRQVSFELDGQSGRADYVLSGERGSLCVLEAKRPDLDPYDAKEQARGYAENLRAPFVILSNGKEHWFWNYERADQRDAFRIERIPSLADLERLRLKNLQPPRPLLTEVIGPNYLKRFKDEITLRHYQIKAIDEVSKQFDRDEKRKFLLEMATGTGKTLLCAALIRRFLATRNAERVLFIVDRIELAKQTMEDFNLVLREYSPVIFKTARRHRPQHVYQQQAHSYDLGQRRIIAGRPSRRITSRHHSPSVMPSLSATAASLSYSLSVILQPTVRVRGWSAGIGKGLRGGQVDSLLLWQENQQVNGERPGALQSAGDFVSFAARGS